MANEHGADEQTQFLTFHLVDETYAVSILRVREIIEFGTITRVPNMPPSIRGVINLRGAVVPVVDLVKRFKLGESCVTKRTCVIIAEFGSSDVPVVMGLMADSVSQVINLPPGEIEPPPSFGTAIRADFLTGLGKVGKKFVLILNLDRVLSQTELLSANEVRETAEDLLQKDERLPVPVPAAGGDRGEAHA